MDKSFFSIYKVQVLISITLSIAIIALAGIRNPLQIGLIIAGTLVGTFFLDLEYFLIAFVLDTKIDFSKTLQGYISHKDLANAAIFIDTHKNDLKEKSLNSGLFQVVLAFLSIFVIYSTDSNFAKALVLSIFANSIYKGLEVYFVNLHEEWFWAFKSKPTKQMFAIFLMGMVVVLSYCLYIF